MAGNISCVIAAIILGTIHLQPLYFLFEMPLQQQCSIDLALSSLMHTNACPEIAKLAIVLGSALFYDDSLGKWERAR